MRFNAFAGAAVAALLAYTVLPTTALAGPDGHGAADNAKLIGAPGQQAQASRTVEISLQDNYFEPESIQVKAGETVRFVVQNDGDFVHEFAIATPAMHVEHQPMMQMLAEHEVLFPDRIDYEAGEAMQKSMGHGLHEEPNSVLLEPGKSGEIIWTFPSSGTLEFACNVPGHYEGGMVGEIKLQ